VGERLRAAWDFDDLDSTERRFGALLEQESSAAGRAEVLTQLARVEGLRGRFAAGERLLGAAEELADPGGAASVRVALERGRLLRSSGRPEAAMPLFESAYAAAVAIGEGFLAADAAHMAALAAPDQAGRVAWTQRGIDLARDSAGSEAGYWLGPLLNNLGWEYFEAGEYSEALGAFEGALRARELRPEQTAEIEIARYAVAKALRALGRPQDAASLLEQAVAWTQAAGQPDGWFH
jgi:tetratricopeptide (TPR) repeat protein